MDATRPQVTTATAPGGMMLDPAGTWSWLAALGAVLAGRAIG